MCLRVCVVCVHETYTQITPNPVCLYGVVRCLVFAPTQEEEIQKAIFVGNYDGAVDTCLKAGRLADALLIANIGGAELFKKTMQRYMRRNPRPYMAVGVLACRARALSCTYPTRSAQCLVRMCVSQPRPRSTHTRVILDTAVLAGLLARCFCTLAQCSTPTRTMQCTHTRTTQSHTTTMQYPCLR